MTLEFVSNVLIATILGFIIGIERQWGQHPAGLRTNGLVALGAALFVSISALVGDDKSPTRIASYVVSGLGFLGGGVILRDGMNVKGINTAATIWCTGAVATLSGLGYYFEAIIGTIAILVVHLVLRPLVHWIDYRNLVSNTGSTSYLLTIECNEEQEKLIRSILIRHVGGNKMLNLKGISSRSESDKDSIIEADIFAPQRADQALEEIIARVSIEPGLKNIHWKQKKI